MLELLGGLSLVTDIGTGSPLEESLKRCLVATRLARILGCTEPEVSDVLYTALLQHLGCTAYAHEVAKVWGDDIVTTRVNFLSSSGEPQDLWRVWIPGSGERDGQIEGKSAGDDCRHCWSNAVRGPSSDLRGGSRGLARAGTPRTGAGWPVAHVCAVGWQGLPDVQRARRSR